MNDINLIRFLLNENSCLLIIFRRNKTSGQSERVRIATNVTKTSALLILTQQKRESDCTYILYDLTHLWEKRGKNERAHNVYFWRRGRAAIWEVFVRFSCQKDGKTHSCPQLEEASFSGEKTQYMGLDEQE